VSKKLDTGHWQLESQYFFVDLLHPVDRERFIRALAGLDLEQVASESSGSGTLGFRRLRAVAASYVNWLDAQDDDIVTLQLVDADSFGAFYRAIDAGGYAQLAGIDLPSSKSVGVVESLEVSVGKIRQMDAAVSKGVGQLDRRLFEPGPRIYKPSSGDLLARRSYNKAIRDASDGWMPFFSDRDRPRAVPEADGRNPCLEDRLGAGLRVEPALFVEVAPLLAVAEKALVVSGPRRS